MEIFTTAIGLILSGDADLMTIIALSLRVSLSATLIAALFAIPAGAALAILVLAVNLLGDWLRDALNPKLR